VSQTLLIIVIFTLYSVGKLITILIGE